jgi:tetratricopeptide (TPR) repeat protein
VVALVLVAASFAEIDDFIRRGNATFASNDYQAALQWYTRAEEQTTDPGLVAFNKAAALYRLERFREAELHYRRCLEDAVAPPARRARAWYDLGNCLVKQASTSDVKALEVALDCYREAVRLAGIENDLAADVRHNFELARLLWLEARAKAAKTPERPQFPEPKNGSAKASKTTQNGTAKADGKPDKSDDKGTEKNGDGEMSSKDRKKIAALGKLLVLPDEDRLVALSPEDTVSFLERARQRVLRERREYRQQAAPVSDQVKDW